MYVNDKLVQIILNIKQVHQSIVGEEEEYDWCQIKRETRIHVKERKSKANPTSTVRKKFVVLEFY